jgi:hypothetical protein
MSPNGCNIRACRRSSLASSRQYTPTGLLSQLPLGNAQPYTLNASTRTTLAILAALVQRKPHTAAIAFAPLTPTTTTRGAIEARMTRLATPRSPKRISGVHHPHNAISYGRQLTYSRTGNETLETSGRNRSN